MDGYYYYTNYLSLSMYVAEQMKRMRESRHLRQDDVAKHLGISRQAYSKLENNITNINVDILENLCHVFNVGIADFFPEHLLEKKPLLSADSESLSYQSLAKNSEISHEIQTLEALKLISGYASLSRKDQQSILEFIDRRLH